MRGRTSSLPLTIPLLPGLLFPIAYSSGLHEDANEVDFQRKKPLCRQGTLESRVLWRVAKSGNGSGISRQIWKWEIINPDDPDKYNRTKLLAYSIVIGP
ncbi:hypothetical protein TNCV_1418921 [Trichonephila clavipes]|nr:hypothetical protein TNCV_1418921 [Trichonephila clavipes]